MASIKLTGDTSGEITISAPAVAGTNTLTLPAETGTIVTNVNGDVYPLTSGTAVVTSGGETAIDFTGIPSWVRKITFQFFRVTASIAASTHMIVQLGTDGSGFQTSGYVGSIAQISGSNAIDRYTEGGGLIMCNVGANSRQGQATLSLLNPSTGTWVYDTCSERAGLTTIVYGGGGFAMTDTNPVTKLRITTASGTDTFLSNSEFNIIYE